MGKAIKFLNEEKLWRDNAKYKFEVPEGISACEEIILRFGDFPSLYPIMSLIIRAGYGFYVIGEMFVIRQLNRLEEKFPDLGIFMDIWAKLHSDEWIRYQFDRWDELKEEVSKEINRYKSDDLQLKKFIGKLLLPFYEFNTFEKRESLNLDENSNLEARLLISEYSQQRSFSAEDFIFLWKRAVEKSESYKKSPLTEYEEVLKRNLSIEMSLARKNDWQTDEEAMAFFQRSLFSTDYAGCIAGCLLENGVKLEYMDYQKLFGVYLVENLSVFDVARSMDWSEEAVRMYKPKKLSDWEYMKHLDNLVNDETNHEKEDDDFFERCGRPDLPNELKSPEAIKIWKVAIKKKIIDSNLNFKLGTGIPLGYFGAKICEKLGLIDNRGRLKVRIIKQWNKYEYYSDKNREAKSPDLKEDIRIKIGKIDKLFAALE